MRNFIKLYALSGLESNYDLYSFFKAIHYFIKNHELPLNKVIFPFYNLKVNIFINCWYFVY